ncbi:MAG: NAD-dependent epimerase/dehydratase family protein [Microbacterium sp.]|uniref:NAD-dependent epimerase/dehydratase family protein n=1 Tax=Microbacterium sp. TaxID=51671 RepID=UPI002721CFFE|nr:NAD-dependent epimerase/dehydratase family protein [Microbacterium sp.]MDO8381399.1 NAD-dependent epimerase/dehydratase family protein [Microbacterium sp.]
MPRRVLITGGAGFIGSRLAERFAGAGDVVTVLDCLLPQVHGDDPDRSESLQRAQAAAEVVIGDVISRDDLRSVVGGQDIIVHLAALTGTGQSMYEIDRYTHVNIQGTARLLDVLAAEENAVSRLVVASSRSVYGEGSYRSADGVTVYPEHRREADLLAGDFDVHLHGADPLSMVPTRESALLHPSSIYGITKQVQEQLVMTASPTLGIEPVSLRYQNVYGPGQSLNNPYTGILSIFSSLIRQGKEVNIFEDGLESRDFVYVDDVVEATYMTAVSPAAAGQIFNVGSGTATTVLDVVAALSEAYGRAAKTRVSGSFRIGDIRHNVADVSAIEAAVGFRARVPFPEGVRRFAAWAAEQPLTEDMYQRSLDEMAARNLLK